MPVTARRPKTPLFSLLLAVILVATPFAIFAQGGGQGRGGGGRGAGAPGGAPAGAPAAPGAPPAGGPIPAAPGGGQGRGGFGGAQGAGGGTAKAAAPVDFTGYWVSLVTEDWIERMAPDSPPSGVVRGGAAGAGARGGGRGAAPAPGGEQCRAYAAGGSLRVPTRLNITWADDNTLKIDMDSGTQTRLLHFNAPPPAAGTPKSLQGYSAATWETGGGGRGGGRGGPAPAAPRWGSLNVVTTNMSGGYLLSSRSSYSENATLTEYFSRHSDFGNDYFTVTATVQDGGQTRTTSSTFKKEPNGSKFSPSGCDVVR